MAIHGLGSPMKASEIKAEFSPTITPFKLGDHYRTGSYVGDSTKNSNISSSRSNLKFSQFYGAENYSVSISFSVTSETPHKYAWNNNASITITVSGTSNSYELRHVSGTVTRTNGVAATFGGMDSGANYALYIIDNVSGYVWYFLINPGYDSEVTTLSFNGSVLTSPFTPPTSSNAGAPCARGEVSSRGDCGCCTGGKSNYCGTIAEDVIIDYCDGVGGTYESGEGCAGRCGNVVCGTGYYGGDAYCECCT